MALRSHSLAFTGLWISANGQMLLIFIRLLKGITCILIFLYSLFLNHCNLREFQAHFWIRRNVIILNGETVFLHKAFVCRVCLYILAWRHVSLSTHNNSSTLKTSSLHAVAKERVANVRLVFLSSEHERNQTLKWVMKNYKTMVLN